MYKKVTGPSATKTALLKAKTGEVIMEQRRQLEHWVEQYLEPYATQNMVSDAALDALPHLSVMQELDTVPTVAELSKAYYCLFSGKAIGKDGIPSEVLKSGKSVLSWYLHVLLCLCWQRGYIPHDMYDANSITLYKKKGDSSDYKNFIASPF